MNYESWPNPWLVMLIGLPGSGKSTYCRSNLPKVPILSTDDIIEKYAKDKGKTYSEVFTKIASEAGKHVQQKTKKFIKDRQSVIIDQTNMTRKSRTNKLIPFEGYYKVAIIVTADPVELTLRLKLRAEQTGKYIPQNVIDQMAQSFQTIDPSEGWNEVHYIHT